MKGPPWMSRRAHVIRLTAAAIQEYPKYARKWPPPHPTYLDYGHDPQGAMVIWWWHGGVLQTLASQPGDQKREHNDVIFKEFQPGDYAGRYDAARKVVTVMVTEKHQHRDLPAGLQRDLERKFPETTSLVVYR
jgi:hypothetical protein